MPSGSGPPPRAMVMGGLAAEAPEREHCPTHLTFQSETTLARSEMGDYRRTHDVSGLPAYLQRRRRLAPPTPRSCTSTRRPSIFSVARRLRLPEARSRAHIWKDERAVPLRSGEMVPLE
ncbi:unnamed protein product [Prorocentrum cordatum]|uniref:Uncharacterized protein n=1 Tax=Prorocentrum cordatum TaxID=2364126 RepID=A0ABN9WHP1_9DINO|nr:unnamed protein product [Polarella glacialis]